MKKILIILFTLLSFTIVAQQNDSLFKLYKTYKITATDFSVDQMGNLYIATPSMQLKKINEKGDSLAVFNLSKRYGKLSYIDVNNPLKALLYFKNFSTIISVDRKPIVWYKRYIDVPGYIHWRFCHWVVYCSIQLCRCGLLRICNL